MENFCDVFGLQTLVGATLLTFFRTCTPFPGRSFFVSGWGLIMFAGCPVITHCIALSYHAEIPVSIGLIWTVGTAGGCLCLIIGTIVFGVHCRHWMREPRWPAELSDPLWLVTPI